MYNIVGPGSKFRGVRKGSWTDEEDDLLRKCIQKFGEGNWHRVPQRAGLNRCRKSCRLRWMNYLKPNIKRGQFSEDEVDLILRLHKLLGNRWSLIAGRLPGRTANDVKNYWNTHLHKKLSSSRPPKYPTTLQNTSCKGNSNENNNSKKQATFSTTIVSTTKTSSPTNTQIIRPQPWTFPKTTSRVMKPGPVTLDEPVDSPADEKEDGENGGNWWESFLLEVTENEGKESNDNLQGCNGPGNGPGYNQEPGSKGESSDIWTTLLFDEGSSSVVSVGEQYTLGEDDDLWNFEDKIWE